LLIVFDLDDTLIDTSGAVTPFKMRRCLMRLVEEGFQVGDFEQEYKRLLSLNETAPRSGDALLQFVGGEADWVQKVVGEMTTPLPASFAVPTTPNAKEILDYLAKSHRLALVTGGHPPFQLQKLEKAGIDRSIFSKIAIPEDSIKKPFY
jgi:FMN phosphatase YigB (HAD superfamily)